jgi:hypothetical protein
MTLGGGIAGIVVGVLLSRLVTWYAGWRTSISAGSIAVAIGVSAAVGIGLGLDPAVTAARSIQMDARRREGVQHPDEGRWSGCGLWRSLAAGFHSCLDRHCVVPSTPRLAEGGARRP